MNAEVVNRYREFKRDHECEVVGCDQPAPWRRYCGDCEAQSEDLDKWVAKVRIRSAQLRDIAWATLAIAMMSALGYYFWPYVWAIWKLWTSTGAN